MAILHLKITKNDEIINLPREIHGQNFKLVRVSVKTKPIAAGGTEVNQGGVAINLSFITGYEIISPIRNNMIFLCYDEYKNTNNQNYDQNLDSEDIPLSFRVQTFKYEGSEYAKFVDPIPVPAPNPLPEPVAGDIKRIDLFFEFDRVDLVRY
jgi:hypothetical protein